MIGIDESGRGAWAGPLFVVALILRSKTINGLADSKSLDSYKRSNLYGILCKNSHFGIGVVSAPEIDSFGISWAQTMGCLRALEQLEGKCELYKEEIVLDGSVNYLKGTKYSIQTITKIKADATVACVSAASIVAKHLRDEAMIKLDLDYPCYGLLDHKGYGTKKHMTTLSVYGACPEHRFSYRPLLVHAKGKSALIFNKV